MKMLSFTRRSLKTIEKFEQEILFARTHGWNVELILYRDDFVDMIPAIDNIKESVKWAELADRVIYFDNIGKEIVLKDRFNPLPVYDPIDEEDKLAFEELLIKKDRCDELVNYADLDDKFFEELGVNK